MSTSLADATIATAGAGIMGGLLVERLIEAGGVKPGNVIACDPDEGRLNELAARLGIETHTDNTAAPGADVILLAVPPPAVVPVLEEIAEELEDRPLIVSVAPSISIERMQQVAGGAQVARVMPNTPSLVGAGMNAYCVAEDATAEAVALLREMLDVWGESIEVPENCMNAACALLAVGPTYLFPVIDTLMAETEDAGMPTEMARRAAAGLFAGVGDLVEQTEATPEELKQMISMQPLDDEAAATVFREAYHKALAGLQGLESKLSS